MKEQKAAQDWPTLYRYWADNVRHPDLQAFYATELPGPETPLGEVGLVALDIETTGLDARQHAVVSIGVQPFTLQRIALAENRYWVVKPRRELLERSVTIHRITHDEIEHAPDIREALPELMQCLAGRIAVVHFQHIERPFLDAAMRSRFAEGWQFPLIDTMSLEARFQRLGWRARLRRWLGKPAISIRLSDTRERYHLPIYSPHHAGVDALATAELLQAQIAHRFSDDTPLGALWE